MLPVHVCSSCGRTAPRGRKPAWPHCWACRYTQQKHHEHFPWELDWWSCFSQLLPNTFHTNYQTDRMVGTAVGHCQHTLPWTTAIAELLSVLLLIPWATQAFLPPFRAHSLAGNYEENFLTPIFSPANKWFCNRKLIKALRVWRRKWKWTIKASHRISALRHLIEFQHYCHKLLE